MKAFVIALFLGLASVQIIQAAKLARNFCNRKWSPNENLKCYKDGVNRAAARDSSFPIPEDAEKRRLENAVNTCFINQFQCKSSPIPMQQQTRDRQDCFTQMKSSLISQLQQCTKRCIDDFVMPEDPYDPQNDWTYRVLQIQNILKNPRPMCGGVKKPDLVKCVNNNGYDFNKRPPNKQPPYVCQVNADCWYNIGQECQYTWEYQVRPQLCQCSTDMIKAKAIKTSQDQYKTCMTNRGQPPPKDDPVYRWVDNYLKQFCVPLDKNPCRRELEEANRRQSSVKSG